MDDTSSEGDKDWIGHSRGEAEMGKVWSNGGDVGVENIRVFVGHPNSRNIQVFERWKGRFFIRIFIRTQENTVKWDMLWMHSIVHYQFF